MKKPLLAPFFIFFALILCLQQGCLIGTDETDSSRSKKGIKETDLSPPKNEGPLQDPGWINNFWWENDESDTQAEKHYNPITCRNEYHKHCLLVFMSANLPGLDEIRKIVHQLYNNLFPDLPDELARSFANSPCIEEQRKFMATIPFLKASGIELDDKDEIWMGALFVFLIFEQAHVKFKEICNRFGFQPSDLSSDKALKHIIDSKKSWHQFFEVDDFEFQLGNSSLQKTIQKLSYDNDLKELLNQIANHCYAMLVGTQLINPPHIIAFHTLGTAIPVEQIDQQWHSIIGDGNPKKRRVLLPGIVYRGEKSVFERALLR